MTKTAPDVRRYAAAIGRTKPDLIIETGTWRGASAEWFSQFAPVITIDIDPYNSQFAQALDRVTAIVGSSVSHDVLHTVYALAEGHNVMVSLDSDHSPEHVLREMNAYASLVQVGGYLVVEDGIVRHWLQKPGPLDAIEAWLPEHPEWSADMELEDSEPTTLFPSN
jgi:cephalosporin hydroxylase